MARILGYPYPANLVAAPHDDRVAWTINKHGVRNIWAASGPNYRPRQVTHYTEDNGQELTQLTFSPDGHYLVYVRGGDHDANWSGGLAPDPASNPVAPKVMIWAIALPDGNPVPVASGDSPVISANNRLAFLKDGQVWTAPLDGHGKAQRLFFDRGHDRALRWSPDGSMLAFVSSRGDHAFIGIFRSRKQPLEYLAPSTHRDSSPRWSPDGTHIAFVHRPGLGGPSWMMSLNKPRPWSIQVADVATGAAHTAWRSPRTPRGSLLWAHGGAHLNWAAGHQLVFLAALDGWPHLYSVAASGAGKPLLLTPGDYMVEQTTMSPDRSFLIYNANTGTTPHDADRRHLFRVPVDAATPVELTSGMTLEWQPIIVAGGKRVAFISAGPRRPPLVRIAALDGHQAQFLDADQVPADFPADELVVPQAVSFKSPDGWTIHGQLFRRNPSEHPRPAIIYVHGGPPRQMLLGWHYMGAYSNSYAVNQYLATHGFTVLSINYRLGIGHGYAFQHPENWGPFGASEYQDVVAGARYLQRLDGVDPNRIGIWGESYGGYLTALALARNSDIFKAGADWLGVHDWSLLLGASIKQRRPRYENSDPKQMLKLAWESSPDADVAKWRSPVLLIQGDDDRNVHFHQTVDLVRRLQKHDVPYEEMVLPNEIHGFLLYRSLLKADTATADFFHKELQE